MAGYQNHMRCGNSGNMYQQRNTGRNCMQRMPERRENGCCNEQRMPERRENGCCNELADMPLAMAYVPWQRWREINDVCEGFQRGTIFRELDMPFKGKGGCNR